MIYNNKDIGEPIVEATFIIKKNQRNTYIKISSKDEKSIIFTFNTKDFNPQRLEMNQKINIIEKIYWDVELVTKDTYYLFDISKDVVNLTRLDDNLFNIEVSIDKPNMIFCPLGEKATFNNLLINKDFSFKYKDNK